MENKTLSNKFITKLSLSFFLIIVVMGCTFIFISLFFSNKFFQETKQKLNINLAQHLIDEKFKDTSPFLENGEVNKPLFGDIMHNMMAVNRGIEVYLLNMKGEILYSVVLDHSNPNKPLKKVNLLPIKKFIKNKGAIYVLGDDPRNPTKDEIFSAAHYTTNNAEGYIYIVLTGQAYQNLAGSLASSYFIKLGTGASLFIMLFSIIIGWLSIRFLTKNLREIVFHVKRFGEGDFNNRIENPENSDLSVLAVTYNQMADTISQNIEEIKSVDILRRELIANVSHDLRTPLAVMQGYVETLQIKKGKINEIEKQEYINIIENSSKQLSKLVSQLFEYSKLEAKQIEPQREPFVITDLVYEVQSNYMVLANKKNIDLSVQIVDEIPLVFADIGLVERVINNLIDNAIKFTPKNGSIQLIVFQKNNNISVQIKDSGYGISKEDQQFVFERFRQSKSTQEQLGTGLGLAIAKKIMELHGSTIDIISSNKGGSVFEFMLPVS